MVHFQVGIMRFLPLANFNAEWWKRFIGGLFAAVFLLPVPAYATISGFSWNSPVPSGDTVVSSVDTSLTTSPIGILRLTLVGGPRSISQPTTWSITGQFNVVDGADDLSGVWTSLNNISSINGNINIKVTLTGNSITNNMFGSFGTDYSNTNPPPASQNLTTSQSLPVFNGYTVTILFTFQNGTSFQANSSTPVTLTLN
jgi:hypothetical protein